ncbi:F-box/kelch-repeat protein At3g06240-like [Castanea sativa]|uniref:F-box/kelch-repeat protein At3g06240-like n=1 Tax=Castanea sativa TaxID=21020 RepID=UPI003F64F406
MGETRPQQPFLRHGYLPYDIVLNILARLPVKSVIRFRYISKSYDSSITNPNFISTHLKNIKDSHDNDNGFVIHMPSVTANIGFQRPVCTVALDRTFDRISELGIPFDFHYIYTQIVGSCNGLLCFANSANVVYLWNPSIRMFKKLPDTCLGQLKDVTLGFAYHPENNDYKVVRISCLSLFTHEIEVYTLSSDSWRSVGTASLTATNVMFYDKNYPLPIPLVNGALHWVSNVVEGEKNCRSRMIMAFDVNSERFRELALPDGSVDENTFQTFLALFKGKLALIAWEHSEQPGTQYSVWVMKEYGVVESWNKLFVVPFERVAHCIAFTEYGSLLVCYISDQVEAHGFKFVLVDTETLHEKKDPDIQHYSSVATFMESLVLFDGANVVSY